MHVCIIQCMYWTPLLYCIISVLYWLAFIHFYTASLSMSHSEVLLATALIMCQSLHDKALHVATGSEELAQGPCVAAIFRVHGIRTCDLPRHRTLLLSYHAPQ